MNRRTLLTANEIETALSELNASSLVAWEIKDSKLLRRYDFKSFSDAFAFMTQVAIECERLDHHPRWVNVWNVVEISLFTFKVKGLTELDFDLSGRMEKIARKFVES